MATCDTFLTDRLAKTEAIIIAYEDAMLAFTDPTILSYDLDTIQDRQRVTRQDLDKLAKMLDSLYERRNSLQIRCNGGGAMQVVPCFG